MGKYKKYKRYWDDDDDWDDDDWDDDDWEDYYRRKWEWLLETSPEFEEYVDENFPDATEEDIEKCLGSFGEYLTEYEIKKNIQGYYKVLRNLYIPYGNNKNIEIDLVVIHQKGIFVIESKNVSGWIFGSEKDRNWTQSLRKKKYKIYNPILQNRTHIQVLSNYIRLHSYRMKSFIVFSERCELMKVPDNTKEYTILNRYDLTEEMAKDLEERKDMFTKKQVDYITNKLLPTTKVSETTKEEHIQDIKYRHQEED